MTPKSEPHPTNGSGDGHTWSAKPLQADAVLLCAYNRPVHTKRVLEQIGRTPPRRLYISLDGPKPDETDKRKVSEVRRVVESFKYQGEILLRSGDKNLGCKHGVASAVDWFFSHEPHGIVLEDDILPSRSFFSFCQELLERYRNDSRVMKISGFNLMASRFQYPADYFFSHVSFSWGWATWARAWEHMDLEMLAMPLLKSLGLRSPTALDSHTWRALRTAERGVDTWDYQWDFSIASQNGLHVVPVQNLVRNIGFGVDATHTRIDHSSRAMVESSEVELPLNHGPGLVMPSIKFQRLLRRKQMRDRLLGVIWKVFGLGKGRTLGH